MKYLASNIFSQHYRFERKPSCSPHTKRQRYERGRGSDIRYQEEEQWRRTPQPGYEVCSSSQPDLYQPAGYVNGAEQYSQSVDYYHEQYHKYF